MGQQLQLDVHVRRQPAKSTVSKEAIWAKRNSGAAFDLACSESNLDDKEIYTDPRLNIDAGTFSKIGSSTATLQGDKVAAFCEVVGNTVYVEWLAYQVGCTLTVLQSEAERRAIAAEARAKKAEEFIDLLLSKRGA